MYNIYLFAIVALPTILQGNYTSEATWLPRNNLPPANPRSHSNPTPKLPKPVRSSEMKVNNFYKFAFEFLGLYQLGIYNGTEIRVYL
jgi:hypothetical protein